MMDIGEKQFVSSALLGPVLFPMVERKPVGECSIVSQSHQKAYVAKAIKNVITLEEPEREETCFLKFGRQSYKENIRDWDKG